MAITAYDDDINLNAPIGGMQLPPSIRFSRGPIAQPLTELGKVAQYGSDFIATGSDQARRRQHLGGAYAEPGASIDPRSIPPQTLTTYGPSDMQMLPSHGPGITTPTLAVIPEVKSQTPAVSARRLVAPEYAEPVAPKELPTWEDLVDRYSDMVPRGRSLESNLFRGRFATHAASKQLNSLRANQATQQNVMNAQAARGVQGASARKMLGEANLDQAKLAALESGDMARFGILSGRESKEAKAPKVLGFNVAQKTTRLGEIIPGVSSVSFGDYGTIDISPERADAVNKGMDIALTQYLSKGMSYDEAQNAALRDVYGEFRRTNQGNTQ